jgi:hypothetical protein
VKDGDVSDPIRQAKESIPTLDRILDEAWDQLRITSHDTEQAFGAKLVRIDEVATEFFRGYERKALHTLAESWLREQGPDIRDRLQTILSLQGWDELVSKASVMFAEFGVLVQALEKDLGNMRKARGGSTFAKALRRLLRVVGIASETPTGERRERLRRIDLVVPSVDVALGNPERAVFLTCKRTLRERWKQEVPQARPNQRYYLVTIDPELSEGKAREIADMGLIAFVRDDLHHQPNLQPMSWIKSLNDLPTEVRRGL